MIIKIIIYAQRVPNKNQQVIYARNQEFYSSKTDP